MTEETQGASPVEDAPLSPETQVTDSSPVDTPEQTAEQTTEKPDDSGQQRDEEGKFLSPKAQKRIDQLTWEKNEREREAAYWRDLAMQAQRQPEPKAPEPAPKPPTLEEVGYDEAKYAQAMVEYSRAVAREEARKEYESVRKQESEAQRQARFNERVTKLAAEKPQVLQAFRDPTLPVSETMAEIIKDSDEGPDLMAWIVENRDKAAALYSLPPHLAAKEMGRIEAQIVARREANSRPAPAPAPKQVTTAPPPPPTVEAAEVVTPKAPEQMTDAEWYRTAKRKENLKQFKKKA